MVKIKFNYLVRDKSMKLALKKAFEQVLDSGNFILGKEVKKFEEEFAAYIGSKYCIGVGNGQEALQISLMSSGVGGGDEVITTPISAVATTLSILAVGARPVFVDTNEFGLIDPNLISAALTPKTRAILPVHLYGLPIDLKSFLVICKRYKLHLIEDACQAHGSKYLGKKVGTFGSLGCFSFYPTKNLGAFGDGGAIITDNPKMANICREIRDYGQKEKYLHIRYGLNSRLDELQAALLRVELKKLNQNNKARKKIVKRYIKNLKNSPEITILNSENNGNNHLFVIRTKKRDKLQEYLKNQNIETAVHYPLIIPDQPFLKKDYENFNLPIARKFVKEILSLPCYPGLALEEVDYICQKIKEYYY